MFFLPWARILLIIINKSMYLIVVPHSCDGIDCPNYRNVESICDRCDAMADIAAKNLSSVLESNIVLYGDAPRTRLDLNRSESRDSSFRRELHQIVLRKN